MQKLRRVEFFCILNGEAKLYGGCVIELYDLAFIVKRNDHINRAFNDGTVKPLGLPQLVLGAFVLFNFIFQQLVSFFR